MVEQPPGPAVQEKQVEEQRPTYEPTPPVRQETSSLAIVSLVSGILTWILLPFLAAIVAVVTGHMAKREIRQSNGRLTGDGLATAGLVLGYVQLGLIALGLLALIVLVIVAANTAGSTAPAAIMGMVSI